MMRPIIYLLIYSIYNKVRYFVCFFGNANIFVLASPNDTGCSDDLATSHYRLAHAVPIVGLGLTPKPNHIFYWDYNLLKARSGWSHSLGGRTLL